MKKKKLRGEEAFREYYRTFFTSDDEFEKFLDALRTPSKPVLRFSPRDDDALHKLWSDRGLTWGKHPMYEYAVLWPHEANIGEILPGYEEKMLYPMNASSLLPVLALDVKNGDRVLDACAAPGGKALVINDILGGSGKLIANDRSSARASRMRNIFEEYGARNIEMWNVPAETLFRKYPDFFDKILLDAPCSSEKHVIQSPKHLAEWSHGRIRALKQQQLSLLCGLFRALKTGGRLVYATCAVTREENEDVIEKCLKKTGGRLIETYRQAPDPTLNLDPMFYAILEKTN
ncbi:MAG: RsmB/NOP family class I SAM-dependent RNA methyltransferase [Patescibacteria group bacterium]